MTIHLLDIAQDDATVCGLDIRGTTFEYDLGKNGHDELVDPDDFVLALPGDEIPYMRALDRVDCSTCRGKAMER